MIQQKKHKPAVYKTLDIGEAGRGGLNIQDLDYTLPLSQSPDMVNMMIKNGTFGKRYGQTKVHTFKEDVKSIGRYRGNLYVHVGEKIIKYSNGTEKVVYEDSRLKEKGIFINFNRMLYYLSNSIYIQYDEKTAKVVEPYVPTVLINCSPDGKTSDTIDNYNRIGSGFQQHFNGDGKALEYHLTIPKDDEHKDGLDDTKCKAVVDTKEMTEGKGFTVDHKTGVVTFDKAPNKGQNNVEITAYKTFKKYKESVLDCTCYATFGGQNNSRLFLAGNGSSNYFFSDVMDATYFPDNNYASVGNAEDDITGFGLQYNVLIVFKPFEIYQVTYDIAKDPSGADRAVFYSSPVNAEMGCDMPDTIRYIENRLTWGSTQWGICTLCSTLIQDERNVRVISRNINGGFRTTGLLQEPNLKEATACDYGGLYMICVNNRVYAWDYTNAPYVSSERVSPDDAARNLAWYLWDNVTVKGHTILDRKLYCTNEDYMFTFDESLNDFGEPIKAHYQTPMIDFKAYEMLKTVKKAFFEVRGDTPTRIQIEYITDEMPQGEVDPEDIVVAPRLWESFSWTTFAWTIVNFAKTFARKCSIKKITLFGIRLSNNELNRDMSISGIRFLYTMVKEIK